MNKPKALQLDPEHKTQLEKLVNSGMTPVIIAQRAKILLYKSEGKSNDARLSFCPLKENDLVFLLCV